MERPEFTNEQITWINYIFNKLCLYYDKSFDSYMRLKHNSMRNMFNDMICPKKCECCKKNEAVSGAKICMVCSVIDDHEGPIFK